MNAQVLPVLSGTPQFGRAELDALFEAIDVDGSGTVELKELHKLLRKGADVQLSAVMQAGAKGAIETEARNRHAVRTHARDGAAASPALEASVEAMKKAMVRQCARVVDFFRHLDVNGDGTVARKEFGAALPLLGFGSDGRSAIEALFDALDADGSGTLEYEELNAALRRDDVELSAELQAGAMGEIEVDAKNRIALRTDAEFASIRSKVSELEHKLSGLGL